MAKRTLSRVLKDYRERANLSQLELAAMSGVNQATISDIESDRVSNTSMRTIRKICQALRLDPLEILDVHGWDVHEKDLDHSRPLLINRYEDENDK